MKWKVLGNQGETERENLNILFDILSSYKIFYNLDIFVLPIINNK